MNKWLEKETDKSIIRVLVGQSGAYFRCLIREPVLGKLSKKYFMNQFRILKSKMTYRSSAELLRQVGDQLHCLSALKKPQEEAFFETYLSRSHQTWSSKKSSREMPSSKPLAWTFACEWWARRITSRLRA